MNHMAAHHHRAAARPGILASLAEAMAAGVAAVRREIEITRAERHLERLNDDVLRDIGMHRSEIHAAIRQGRRELGRRYL